MLLTVSLFECVCVLRLVLEFFPYLDKSWDYGPFYTQIGQLSSLAIWFTLFVVNVFLLRKIHNLRGHELALDTEKVVLSFFVIMYHLWMINFVYTKWGHQLAFFIQGNILITIVAFFQHAIYQMDCIFANLYVRTDQLVTQLQSTWTGYVSMHFNGAMILHLVTIVITYDEYEWLWASGWFLPVLIAVVCEIIHRCLAIFVFYKLTRAKHFADLNSYWLLNGHEESDSTQSRLVSPNTIPQIFRGKRTILVTGFNRAFKYLSGRKMD